MTPEIQFRLANRVNELFTGDPDLTGIVITHGTDSLEETAFFLDLLVLGDRPVVFTAAQRPPHLAETDGPRNLLQAVTVAASPSARELGVLVLLNETIHAARDVRKTHAIALDAFQSPWVGPLGYVDDGAVYVTRAPARRVTLKPERIERDVDLITLVAGSDGHLVDAAVAHGAKGIVIEVFGRGNVPGKVTRAIRKALDTGVAVVFTTRTGGGRVELYPPFDTLGVISGEDLDGLKARMALIAVLGVTGDRSEIQRIFRRLSGDVTVR